MKAGATDGLRASAAVGRPSHRPAEPHGALKRCLRPRVCKSPIAIVRKILYWLAVVIVSLALLVGLVIFFESRDDSSLEGRTALPAQGGSAAADRDPYAGSARSSRANTTMR